MTFIDYFLIAIVLVLFLFAIIYLIKNKGCPSSTCASCKYREDCHKKHNKKYKSEPKNFLLRSYSIKPHFHKQIYQSMTTEAKGFLLPRHNQVKRFSRFHP